VGTGAPVLRSMVIKRTSNPRLDVDPIPTDWEDVVLEAVAASRMISTGKWRLGDLASAVTEGSRGWEVIGATICGAAAANAPIPDTQFGVFRM
jgi:hypothetical protein